MSCANATAILRPEVLDFEPYSPGLSIDEIRQRYGLDNVIKLASNENPLGASPLVRKAIMDHADLAFRYPQTGNPSLREAIGARYGLPAARIVAGNGSDEIIDLLVRVTARPGLNNIVVCKPCFSIYRLQSRLCGIALRETPLGDGFSLPVDGLLAAVDEQTALVFVTSPDNPSGYTAPVEDLERLARGLPERCLLVVDEAYMDFAEPLENYSLLPRLDRFPNLVVLRTFSKMFGLAGLRLGYGIMPGWLADYLWRVRLPFSVNILAEKAGLAALADEAFLSATLEAVHAGRGQLSRGLADMGCTVWPSQANFLMFRGPANAPSAGELFEALLRKGVIVRPLKSYGLPDHIRVSVGSERENRAFLTALGEILHG